MAMLKKAKLNTINLDLSNYYYFLQGVEKIGKTTFFRDLIAELYNNDSSKGLLIAVGKEKGYKALDNIYAVDVETWAEFDELVKELVATKGTNGIEFLGVDTHDELVEIAEKECIRLSRVETGKPCKTLNAAFGGYGAGRKRLCAMVDDKLSQLNQLYGLIVVGHTKIKTIKEQGVNEEQEYQVLDCNLNKDYANIVAHKADVIMTAVVEREVVDSRVQNIHRNLYFRSNGFVNAGSRFPKIPEKVPFTAGNFIETIKQAIKDSMTVKVTDTQLEQMKAEQELAKKQEQERIVTQQQAEPETVQENGKVIDTETGEVLEEAINVEKNKQLLAQIQVKFKSATIEQKKAVKELLSANGASKLDVETLNTSVFEQALNLL